MRKDVRIGLSIGGVLLAVLIVYLLVPKDANTNRNGGQQVAQKGTGSQGGADSSGGIGQGAGGATDAGQLPQTGTAPGDANPGPAQHDPNLASRGQGSTPNPDGSPSAGTEQPGQAQANGGVDWAKILDGGIMPPDSLMATKPQDPFADAPRNTPGPQPDWANSGGQSPIGSTPAGSAPNTPHATAGPAGVTGGAITQHTIQRGETLSSISVAVYGDPRYWKEIKKANPNLDDARLKPGMVVKIPDAATVKAAHAPAAGSRPGNAVAGTTPAKVEAAIDPSREYRVQANDSLHKIALKLYGKPAKADSIYELNREKIGGDSARIKVGMVLKLPEAPTQSPTATR